ncbi:hypothetical protein ACT3SP_13230 [Brachybacterium sp. AOP43-C2-M15]|uniref:hypothetical protein n=1 Tax=Brachybacterium sp. AOP43-C2-M15 TaxID=3457661 RepID=UPI00403322E1
MTVHRSRLHRVPVHPRGRGPAHLSLSAGRSTSLLPTLRARLASDRGDVPGWVLITLMTAGILVALWAVASEQIVQIFQNAMAPFLGGSL